jgi:hypothetical protein
MGDCGFPKNEMALTTIHDSVSSTSMTRNIPGPYTRRCVFVVVVFVVVVVVVVVVADWSTLFERSDDEDDCNKEDEDRTTCRRYFIVTKDLRDTMIPSRRPLDGCCGCCCCIGVDVILRCTRTSTTTVAAYANFATK